MLSREGNAGEWWKTAIGLISKKATLHAQHTFLYISVPLFCRTAIWNFFVTHFLDELSYVSLFFTATHFPLHWWLLAFFILSLLLQRFYVVLPTKKNFPLCRFSLWALLAFCLLSLFLCLSPALYSKFVDMLDNEFKLNTYCLCLCFTRLRWLCDFPPK